MTPATGAGASPALAAVREVLARRHGVDLSDYRVETLEAGLAAHLRARGLADPAALVARLEVDPAEREALLSALRVRVTRFGRDPEVLDALARHVLPELRAGAGADGALRVWAAGVATGEEAWSLLLLLDAHPGQVADRVIGSDVDEVALAVARRGRYGDDAVAGLAPADRDRHFRREGGAWVVRDSLRERAFFEKHDLVGPRLAPRSAVVASFDLVVCRNVLIYFAEPLRRRAVARLARVLRPGGALVLAATDHLPGGFEDLLEPWPDLPPLAPIFRRTAGTG